MFCFHWGRGSSISSRNGEKRREDQQPFLSEEMRTQGKYRVVRKDAQSGKVPTVVTFGAGFPSKWNWPLKDYDEREIRSAFSETTDN